MSRLADRPCAPCSPGTPPITGDAAAQLLGQLDPAWGLAADGRSLHREFRFPDFHRTMAFVNALAWIAHATDHHPDLEVGYGRCLVRWQTHSIDGLSDNDFICAARVDALGAAL